MSIADELERLRELHRAGALSDEEFASAKAKLLQPPSAGCGWIGSGDVEQQTRQWAMFLHFSQLAGLVVPLAGLVVPIVVWQLKKPELPEIDVHGKIVVNWILSEIIYAVVSVALVFVFVGIPLLIALGVLAIVFPIIGGIKANNGEVWRYPLSIPFFR